MSIINVTYFQKANLLNIPLSVDAPNPNPAIKSANESDYLTLLCEKIEKHLLINALGLETYKELLLAIEDDFTSPQYAKYQKLVDGEEYDSKVWSGLNNDYSFIAFKIYEEFLTETNTRLSGIGNVKVNTEKATTTTPAYKIATASQEFYKGYQGGYLFEPIICENFIDWFGQKYDVEVSFYQYMIDKKDDFSLFDIEKFRIYDELNTKNSFGI